MYNSGKSLLTSAEYAPFEFKIEQKRYQNLTQFLRNCKKRTKQTNSE